MTIETIEFDGRVFALILRRELEVEGTKFFTQNDSPLQLGILKHKKDSEIKPHIHKPSKKIIDSIQEVLHIEYGIVEADFYDDSGKKLGSNILNAGDTILLIAGGHGFVMNEDSKVIEIKQGPYQGSEVDKEYMEVKNDSSL